MPENQTTTTPKFDTFPQDDTTVEQNQVTRSEGINNPEPVPAINLRTGQQASSSTATAVEQKPQVIKAGSPTSVVNTKGM